MKFNELRKVIANQCNIRIILNEDTLFDGTIDTLTTNVSEDYDVEEIYSDKPFVNAVYTDLVVVIKENNNEQISRSIRQN